MEVAGIISPVVPPRKFSQCSHWLLHCAQLIGLELDNCAEISQSDCLLGFEISILINGANSLKCKLKNATDSEQRHHLETPSPALYGQVSGQKKPCHIEKQLGRSRMASHMAPKQSLEQELPFPPDPSSRPQHPDMQCTCSI